MPDLKISQLPLATSLSATDLLAISQSMGSGQWESRSIDASTVLNSLGATRLLKVSKDGTRDADTIKDAIALAVALNPTEFNPVAIQVVPGAYIEDNPIIIPEWISIYSEGGVYSVGVIALNDGEIFIGSGNSELNGFSIVGMYVPANMSNVAYKSSVATTSIIKNCIIINCLTAILSDNGSVAADYVTGLSFQRVFEKFMASINAGFISATNCSIIGIMTNPVYGFYSSGSGSELYLFTSTATRCVNGVYASDDGYIDVMSSHFAECDNGMVISATGSSHIKAIGCVIEESNGYDLQVLSSTARLSFSGSFDSYSRQIVSGATVIIVADDEGNVGAKFTGESSVEGAFAVGYPGATYEEKDIIFNIGDGRSYYRDQYGDTVAEYWSWNNATSSFLPYTTYAGAQLAGDGDAIIVGSKFPFPAIRLEVTTAANVGSNYIAVEYWNGTAWVETSICAYDRQTMSREDHRPFEAAEDHYVEISQKVLENVGQVNGWDSAYDVAGEIPAWTVGYPLYALRFRNDGALVNGMTFRNGRIRGDGSQISTESAESIRWGKFRSKKVQYIDSETFSMDAVYPPAFATQIMSSHITYANLPNFKANTISQIASAFIIPSDLDTASPLTCQFAFTAQSSNTGSISTSIYIVRVDTSVSVAGSLPETVYNQSTSAAGVVNSFGSVTQDVDISAYGTNSLVLIGFRRNGTDPSDDYDGDILVGDLVINYYSKFS